MVQTRCRSVQRGIRGAGNVSHRER